MAYFMAADTWVRPPDPQRRHVPILFRVFFLFAYKKEMEKLLSQLERIKGKTKMKQTNNRFPSDNTT